MITKHTISLTLFLLLLCPVITYAQANGQMKQLIRAGALNPLSGGEVRDTVDSSVVVVDEKNNANVVKSGPNRWTDENVSRVPRATRSEAESALEGDRKHMIKQAPFGNSIKGR